MMVLLLRRLLCLLLCTSSFGLFVRPPSGLFASATGTASKDALPSITAGLRPVDPAQKDRDIVVLITGCSSGIGEEAALALSAQSPRFKVWATMRNPAKSSLPDRPNLKVASLDVTDEASIDAAVRHIVATDGAIDVVINNAGFGLAGNVEVVKVEEAQELFNVNVWGVVRLLQAVLPVMRTRRWGYIINLSSTSGVRGIPALDFYTSSKFALEGMMDSLRYSVAAYNISITNVNAGPAVKTPFAARCGSADFGGRGTREVEDADEYLQLLTDRVITGLRTRLNGPDAQPPAEIGHLLANLLTLRLNARRLTDVPFNIGSNHDSQHLLEEVRVNPTGWGGVYSEIFKSLPPLPSPTEAADLRRRRLQATQPSPLEDL